MPINAFDIKLARTKISLYRMLLLKFRTTPIDKIDDIEAEIGAALASDKDVQKHLQRAIDEEINDRF